MLTLLLRILSWLLRLSEVENVPWPVYSKAVARGAAGAARVAPLFQLFFFFFFFVGSLKQRKEQKLT